MKGRGGGGGGFERDKGVQRGRTSGEVEALAKAGWALESSAASRLVLQYLGTDSKDAKKNRPT